MPDWFPTWLITLAQILQMVVGVFVAFNYYRVLSSGGSCAVSTDLLWACAVMYSTYLYLFVEFAVKRYVRACVVALGCLWDGWHEAPPTLCVSIQLLAYCIALPTPSRLSPSHSYIIKPITDARNKSLKIKKN